MHRSTLPGDEVTAVVAVPATTVARTLLDLARVLDRHHLDRAINEAEVRRLDAPGCRVVAGWRQ
jgi:hypothetical protein